MSRGDGREFRRAGVWWIDYSREGRRIRESARTKIRSEAAALRRSRLEALTSGRESTEGRRMTVEAALRAYLENLGMRRGTLAEAQHRTHARRVAEALGTLKLEALTPERIDAYAAERYRSAKLRGTGTLAPAKVNRELAVLRAALRLAHKRDKLGRVPGFTFLREPAPRQAYFDSLAEFEQFASHLAPDLRDVAEAGYLLGWRREELLGLRWEHVALNAEPWPEVRLPRTKNDEARVVPLAGARLQALFERRATCRKVTLADGSTKLAEWVFHRDGEPIGGWRMSDAWRLAIKAAGFPRRTFHDLRRTAARNLVCAGVAEHLAMKITGHKTPSVFRRYAIMGPADLAAALQRSQEHVEGAQAESNVRAYRRPVSEAK